MKVYILLDLEASCDKVVIGVYDNFEKVKNTLKAFGCIEQEIEENTLAEYEIKEETVI